MENSINLIHIELLSNLSRLRNQTSSMQHFSGQPPKLVGAMNHKKLSSMALIIVCYLELRFGAGDTFAFSTSCRYSETPLYGIIITPSNISSNSYRKMYFLLTILQTVNVLIFTSIILFVFTVCQKRIHYMSKTRMVLLLWY